MEDKKISLDDIIEELDNNFIKPIKNSFLEDELQFLPPGLFERERTTVDKTYTKTINNSTIKR